MLRGGRPFALAMVAAGHLSMGGSFPGCLLPLINPIHEKENRKFVHPVEDGRSFGQLKEAMKHYVKSDKKEDGYISTYSTDNQ